MSKEKNKILTDTLNYLKYYRDYKNYDIYEKDVPVTESELFKTDNSVYSDKTEITESFKDNMKTAIIKNTEEKEIVKESGHQIKEDISIPIPEIRDEKWNECKTLEEFQTEISNCVKCKVLAGQRTNIVFGYGNPKAKIVVVGEAPGAEEDKQGKPFVGRAGKLLTDILKAIKFEREEVYICNILKCRPPENRNPLPEEIMNCEPYLFKQLELIKPKMILALGTFAAQTLLRSKEPLGKMRGIFHTYKGIKMMVTYHPAALLRNPNWKKPTWEDVQLFRKEYDSMMK